MTLKGGSGNTFGGSSGGGSNINAGTSGGGPWDGPLIHYCHTHGYKCPHPSFKCPTPLAHHIRNETKRDIMGGVGTDYKKE